MDVGGFIQKVTTSLVLPMYTTVDAQLTTGRLGWKYWIQIQCFFIIHDKGTSSLKMFSSFGLIWFQWSEKSCPNLVWGGILFQDHAPKMAWKKPPTINEDGKVTGEYVSTVNKYL